MRVYMSIFGILLFVNSAFAANMRYAAEIITDGEKSASSVIQTEEIVFADHKGIDSLNVTIKSQGEWVKTEVKISDIKSILIQNPKSSGGSREHGTSYNFDGVLTLRDGRAFEYDNISELRLGVYATLLDPINKSTIKKMFKPSRMKEIRFSDEFGSLRVDSKGNYFPNDYIFSPYTGEKLTFGSL
ncbi:hypothetical protein QNE87_004108 [Vibrio vulnificus]|nr:hypothetical protein [Vibrio vulnificus]